MHSHAHFMIRLVVVAVSLAQLAAVASPTQSSCNEKCDPAEPKSLNCIYCETPDAVTAEMGMFATGVAVGDVNRDGFVDLVFASGNDMSPQPLTVHYGNTEAPVPKYPQWIATHIAYGVDVALGDFDGDGWLDAAVAIGMGLGRNIAGGGVEVYRNREGVLERQPSYRTGSYGAIGVGWGDVDADADLDLVVAVGIEGDETFPPTDLDRIVAGRARIYENVDGELSKEPAWISEDRLQFTEVRVADIDQDGWMDLAFSAFRTAVYYGRPPDADGGIPLPRRADWLSRDTHSFSFGIDAGYRGELPQPQTGATSTPTGRQLMLAISSSRFQELPDEEVRWPRFLNIEMPRLMQLPQDEATRAFLAYQPNRQEADGQPFYKSRSAIFASKVALRDLNADGHLDLIGSQWGPVDTEPPLPGAPLWVFAGGNDTFQKKPDYVSKNRCVGEGVLTADFQNRGLERIDYTFQVVASSAVLTLPEAPRDVISLRRNGEVVSPVDYAWTPDGGWISLAQPLKPGENVTVGVRTSPVRDLALATWDPQYGNDVYYSYLPTGNELSGGTQ